LPERLRPESSVGSTGSSAGRLWGVLLVDDDAVLVHMLRRVLDADGRFTVLGCASSIGQASVQLETITPDVIVLDNGLPDALGAPAARALRAYAPHARVVVVSGSAASQDFAALGVDRWVEKAELFTVPEVLAELMAAARPLP